MSRTIKTVFDDNPTAGNTPADEIYLPIDKGTGDAITYNSDQLANVVADRLGISGNVGTPSALVITIPDNTLTYNIAPISGITYTHYIVISDFTGTITYPSGFVPGSIPATGVLASWNTSENIRVAVYDTATGTQTPILDPNGVDGVAVTPRDTNPPVESITPLTLIAGSTPETEVDYAFGAFTDAETGIDRYEFIDADTGLLFRAIPSGTIGTISNLSPGTTYNLLVRAFDLAQPTANTADTNIASITTASISGGEVNFTLSGYSVSEADGSVGVELTRTVTSGIKGCTISTRTWTAAGQFTVQTNTAVSFADGVATDTITINLTDINADTNNKFEVYIDYDSGTGSTPPSIGANNALLIDVAGTGGSSAFPKQDATTETKLVILCDNADINVPDAVNGDEWKETLASGKPDSANAQGTNVAYHGTRRAYGSLISGPRLGHSGEFTQTGTHYLWVHSLSQALSRDSCFAGIDYTDNSQKFTLETSVDVYGWAKWPLTYNITTIGVHTIDLGQRIVGDLGDGPLFDAVLMTPDASYGPSGAIAQSATGSGIVTDNPNNPAVPTGPLPPTGLTPTRVWPGTAHKHTSLSHPVFVEFDGTGISNAVFVMSYNAGSNVVPGTTKTNGVGQAVFYPTDPYPQATTISWSLTGAIFDSGGEFKQISASDTFITVDENDAAILFYKDFNSGTPHVYTSADATQWNARLDRGYGVSSMGPLQEEVDAIAVDASLQPYAPLEGDHSAHKHALQIKYPANAIWKGAVWGAAFPDAGAVAHVAFDIYHKPGYDFGFGGKLFCGLAGGYSRSSSQDPEESGKEGFSSRCAWFDQGAYSSLLGPTGNSLLTEIETFASRGRDFSYTWSLTDTSLSSTTGWLITAGWNRIECKVTMNSDNTSDGTIEVWANGTKIMNLTGRRWRQNAATGIKLDTLMISTFYGGSTSAWAPTTDQYRLLDNIIVADEPITY